MLGFDRQDQARIATAVSEIARNAIRYARDGSIAYEVEGARAPQILLIRVADRGPGIANLGERSSTAAFDRRPARALASSVRTG
jgi:anti-sigma regulatory factor (Ser/Thr protein kinase)